MPQLTYPGFHFENETEVDTLIEVQRYNMLILSELEVHTMLLLTELDVHTKKYSF